MAFLDNLVSDLIRKSTGFNARPFVRRVGAKNILLLGGAAIAGAIAAEKMRQGSPAQAVPPLPPPIPPPLVPSIPGEESKEESVPKELLFAIVRTMVAGALSDGEIHAEEKKLIEDRLGDSGLGPLEVSQIHKDLVLPPSPAEILRAVPGGEDRELLYRFGYLVVRANSEATEKEKAWLDALAAAAGLSKERRKAIEDEIFSAR
jgi:uncharacterized membrane protein YebE (DUF533 family)